MFCDEYWNSKDAETRPVRTNDACHNITAVDANPHIYRKVNLLAKAVYLALHGDGQRQDGFQMQASASQQARVGQKVVIAGARATASRPGCVHVTTGA
jgi:hypothetical protein